MNEFVGVWYNKLYISPERMYEFRMTLRMNRDHVQSSTISCSLWQWWNVFR